jgi:hypothetical protein
VAFLEKFISVWNEIKFPGFMGETIAVDHLNDTTAFPWFLNFSKNFSADYRKCKSNRWDYLISIHNFENSNECDTSVESDPVCKRFSLINKYNERLLIESNDKDNPLVIDDRDERVVTLHRKKYLDFERCLSLMINTEIGEKNKDKALSKKIIQLETDRLSQLAKWELLAIYKEENIGGVLINDDSYWKTTKENFAAKIALLVNEASIDEIKQIKKKQREIISELNDYFSKKQRSVGFNSITSISEEINAFVIKNKWIQFFSLFWCGLSSHANLLSWISFLFVFFSLALYSYPIIFLMLGISLVGYLGFNFFYLVKKKSLILPEIIIPQADHILESVKIAVFNEKKDEKEWTLIYEMVGKPSGQEKEIKDELFHPISILDKEFLQKINLSGDSNQLNIKESKFYQNLIEVYPKMQFIASMMVNLASVMLYTYLLTWAMHSIFMVLGAASLASFIACPMVVGIFIFITTTFFLARHFLKFLARESFYQRFIEQQLNEECKFSYKDENGNQVITQIKKWEKLEYLQEENAILKSELNNFFKENGLESLNSKFSSLFNNSTFKNAQDKVLGASGSFFKNLKKSLNRFFAFSGGGFYGYNLTQQIVWKSKLGLHILVQTLTLPILLIFIPLIIINGIANLITYHFHSRQQSRFEMAKNLDRQLEFLEQESKKLLYLKTFSNQAINQLDDLVNQKANLFSGNASPLELDTRKSYFFKKFGFFCKKSTKKDLIELKNFNDKTSTNSFKP